MIIENIKILPTILSKDEQFQPLFIDPCKKHKLLPLSTGSLNNLFILQTSEQKFLIKINHNQKHAFGFEEKMIERTILMDNINYKFMEHKTLGNSSKYSFIIESFFTNFARKIFNESNAIPMQAIIKFKHASIEKIGLLRRYFNGDILLDYFNQGKILSTKEITVDTLINQFIINIVVSPFDHHYKNIFIIKDNFNKKSIINIDNARMFPNGNCFLKRSINKYVSSYRSGITDRYFTKKNYPNIFESANVQLNIKQINYILYKCKEILTTLSLNYDLLLKQYKSLLAGMPHNWCNKPKFILLINKRIKKLMDVLKKIPNQNASLEEIIYQTFPWWKFIKCLQFALFKKQHIIFNDNRIDTLINFCSYYGIDSELLKKLSFSENINKVFDEINCYLIKKNYNNFTVQKNASITLEEIKSLAVLDLKDEPI